MNIILLLLLLLADRTSRSMIRYWHDTVCLSVCPSVCDAVQCG